VTRRNHEFLVGVVDPDRDGRESHYVLVVERGAMRIDLVATHRDNTVTTRTLLQQPRLVPGELSPEDIAQAVQDRSGPTQAEDAAAPR
jgi:hypothetical protein